MIDSRLIGFTELPAMYMTMGEVKRIATVWQLVNL
jgi:hypothetical protein